MSKIRIGIVGYGNIGKSVELGIRQNKDMELVGILSRRDPSEIKPLTEGVKAFHIDDAEKLKDEIDVMVLCGGSMKDIPEQGPLFAGMFNTVDCYDNHAKIPTYYEEMNKTSLDAKKVSIISTGWDPGMFSINRIYAEAILPEGKTYTFWGKGVSQGHSDAVRRVVGVKDAKQYTIPKKKAIEEVMKGNMPELSVREKHLRVCYVVAEVGADKKQIEQEIKGIPGYFADYDTEVNFITEEEMQQNHSGMPHGGEVIHYGNTGVNGENSHTIDYKLNLESNPNFTANVMLAYVRAAYRLSKEGISGSKTVAEIAPAYLSIKSLEEIRAMI